MKIQLIGCGNGLPEETFGDKLTDPTGIKRLSSEEREIYKQFNITHVMDARSFYTLYEMYFMKYGERCNKYRPEYDAGFHRILSAYDYENVKARPDGLENWQIWDLSLNRRNSKEIYVKYATFLQEEIPVLNYHLYNLFFTKLNATSFDEWKNSFRLIDVYMCAFLTYRRKHSDFCDKVRQKIDIIPNIYGYFDKVGLMGKKNNDEMSVFKTLSYHAMCDGETVFWDKNRKKETRPGVMKSGEYLFKDFYSLMNFHNDCFQIFKYLYGVKAFNSIEFSHNKDGTSDKFDFSIVDMVENLTYKQYYFEVLMARSMSDMFDPLNVNEISVLKEHGVREYELKRKAYDMFTGNLYRKNAGALKVNTNFANFIREAFLNEKIAKMDKEEVKMNKKKI